ncbi:hypothetical protein DFQ27_006149 [Actinomortierella ambigua]|uniref:DUF803-domain-containing protein n=1 Tax=Actinomortierella ambigua TaxID=1343610 RepID=A0A9P6QK95_9FUNG|nr:hypothetical protein DFQ27_006149 [Actinomortierella ambigua]
MAEPSPSVGTIGASGESSPPPSYYKFIGMGIAIASGLFIGSSFVLKKKGLLRANAIAGEGHAYLKSPMWWSGMILMIVGEACNFIAYSFAPALLVTPLGALSVVVCAVLSSWILKEKLNMHGKIGCALCVVGAVIIVLHSPEQAAVTDIAQFKHFVLQPGFLVYMGIVLVVSLALIWKIGPKYGKKHLLVYITICSLIGSLSVVATQGLGAAIVLNITTGTPQFNQWFIYVTLAFVIITLVTEINYLNKALNLFNTSMVTPIYYVLFTSATIVASIILFQGFSASLGSIVTVVMGFLVICAGIVLLQTSKAGPGAGMGMARSKSSLSLDGEEFGLHQQGGDGTRYPLNDMEKEAMDPGPSGIRAAPFDSIRQMTKQMRATTMPNTWTPRQRTTSGSSIDDVRPVTLFPGSAIASHVHSGQDAAATPGVASTDPANTNTVEPVVPNHTSSSSQRSVSPPPLGTLLVEEKKESL